MRPRRVKTAPGFEKALREPPRELQEQVIEAVARFIKREAEHCKGSGDSTSRAACGSSMYKRKVPTAPTANSFTLVRMTITGPYHEDTHNWDLLPLIKRLDDVLAHLLGVA